MANSGGLDVLSEISLSDNSSNLSSCEHKKSNLRNSEKKRKRLQVLGRLVKDPFNKKKLKESKRRENICERALLELNKKLLDIVVKHPRGEPILRSVENLQIDCINNIQQENIVDFGELQETVEGLTNAANKLIEEITADNEARKKKNAELKLCLERSEMKIDEIKDLVTQCSSKITQYDTSHVQALKDLKELQEAFVTDTPDDKIVSDGISAIRFSFIFDEEYDFLPFKAKLLVTRLFHLFGFNGLASLGEALNIELSDDIIDGCKHSGSEDFKELLLNRDVCAKLLLDWLKKSNDNDCTALCEIMKSHERQRYGAACGQYEEMKVRTTLRTGDFTLERPGSMIADQHDNCSSNSSLSFDENYFDYNSLERLCLNFVKIASTEGIST